MPRITIRRWLQIVLVVGVTVALLGAGDDARFNRLGHKLMCPCGCAEQLLECNHVGCAYSDGMRKELAAAVQTGASDDAILQQFAEKYGTTVLAAPTKHGFDIVAWIMPGVVLVSGAWLAVILIRKWKYRVAPAVQTSATAAQLDAFRARARQETEL
ncbi:MAG TPA: cytochrome c-type biogenesis protein CcmH [Terriglobales bacterium]|nr:cytochrome c-type biogenesis protein CcmH [Terriglobales bacterium]